MNKAISTNGSQGDVIEPMVRVVDLNIGDQTRVELSDGTVATVKLLDVKERRDHLRQAVRRAVAFVEVNGENVDLVASSYRLPTQAGGVQIDCAVTHGHIQYNAHGNVWALDADARLRLWPAGSPWIAPDTFICPAKQRWFASDTQMCNEPCFVDGGEVPSHDRFAYHCWLDFGGPEGLVEVVSATDGQIVSTAGESVSEGVDPAVLRARNDVVVVRDNRGWYIRYAHLCEIDPGLRIGRRIKLGQRIGLLGKEGTSGGWAHLHFDISTPQPSGRFGSRDGYAFIWQAYHSAAGTELQAVARPHHLTAVGEPVALEGVCSWSRRGLGHITDYRWTFSDGDAASGPVVERSYARPGTYSEILKVTDDQGRCDTDFAVVQVLDADKPDELPPTIHAAYGPTTDIKPGDEITFHVRTFRVAPDEGFEVWDFGDGSEPVRVQSDGNAHPQAPDGYAVTTHRYSQPGEYLVSVSRANHRGETATGRLCVHVGDSPH